MSVLRQTKKRSLDKKIDLEKYTHTGWLKVLPHRNGNAHGKKQEHRVFSSKNGARAKGEQPGFQTDKGL